MCAFRLQPLDDLQEVRKRAGKAVDPNHDKCIANAQLIQHTRQNWPGATAARCLLFHNFHAACGAQLLNLGQGGLIFGGNTRVSDEWHGAGGLFAIADVRSKRPFVNEMQGYAVWRCSWKPLGFRAATATESALHGPSRARAI